MQKDKITLKTIMRENHTIEFTFVHHKKNHDVAIFLFSRFSLWYPSGYERADKKRTTFCGSSVPPGRFELPFQPLVPFRV